MADFIPYLIIGLVAFSAAILTFFSGFGLGTLLLPAFALFVNLELAIAMTAIVHLTNNVLKLGLVFRGINLAILCYFGVGALIGAGIGSFLLTLISDLGLFYKTTIWGSSREVNFIEFTIGILMLCFAIIEFYPKIKFASFPLSIGGFISGFFGGLSGHQGALRSAFLAHRNLKKEVFIATGVCVSLLVDLTRLIFYKVHFSELEIPFTLLIVGILAAIIGSVLGKILFAKTTMKSIQKIVCIALVILGTSILTGLI